VYQYHQTPPTEALPVERLGNLLLETATLYLVGREVGRPVHLLPQVAAKLHPYFSSLPLPVLNQK